jgi:hypothetical protein
MNPNVLLTIALGFAASWGATKLKLPSGSILGPMIVVGGAAAHRDSSTRRAGRGIALCRSLSHRRGRRDGVQSRGNRSDDSYSTTSGARRSPSRMHGPIRWMGSGAGDGDALGHRNAGTFAGRRIRDGRGSTRLPRRRGRGRRAPYGAPDQRIHDDSACLSHCRPAGE